MKKTRINNFEESLYYEELENGLKVYVVPIKNKKNFSAMMVTKYGGRDINFKVGDKVCQTPTGIAHFLEHKMFERKDDPFSFYGKYGTDVNAATSDDYTCYYFTGNKCFNKSLKYLLNWIQTLDITEKQVKKEQGIILEEASMYKDNPSRVMYNKVKENIYVNDPKQHKVIGTDEDIVKITKEDLDLCYKNFYVPNNMSLIVTGNVNPKEVISIARDYTKGFKPVKEKAIPIYSAEPDNVNKEYDELYMNVGIPKVNISYKINKECFDSLKVTPFELDLYMHFIINICLGVTSDIRGVWLEKELFTNAFYRITEIESHYVIELHADSQKPDELLKELEKYMLNLKISKDSFEREKKSWISSEIKAIENSMTILYNILDDLLDYNSFIPNKIDYIKELKFETLLRIIELLDLSNKTVIKILPLQSKDKK